MEDVSSIGGDSYIPGDPDGIMSQIYKRYSFNLPPRTDLSIFPNQETIVDTINQNPVTIITSDTGSGKTTQGRKNKVILCNKIFGPMWPIWISRILY
jgi:hypothetical protein